MKRWIITTVLVVLAADARAETRPGYGGVLRGSLLSEPTSFDPLVARSHADVSLSVLVFDTLYKKTTSAAPEPHLAAGPPSVSADGRQVTIELRKGVLFHDKAVLTPQIVATSLRRVLRDAPWLLAPVTSVRASRDGVVLSLRRRAPNVATMLAATATAITRHGRAPGTRPVGTGPFRLRLINRGKRLVQLTAWEHHFAGRPYLTRLDLRWYTKDRQEALAYELGNSHASFRGASPYRGHVPLYRTANVQGPATLLVYVGFGRRNRQITGDRHFRRALSAALSRRAFQYAGRRERVLACVLPVARDGGGPALPRSKAGADLARARAELARAPTITGKLELIVDRTRLDDKRIAQQVLFALRRLGVNVYITELSARQFARRVRRGATDMYIGQLVPPAASAVLGTAAAFAAGGDGWMKARQARVRLGLRQALAAFAKRLPVVPLFHRAVRMHHRTNLRGVGFDSLTMPSYADMYLYGRPRRSRGGS